MSLQDIEEHLLPVASSQVYVRSYGDPALPALILTHGYVQTSACWRRVIPQLSKSHQVIVWDLPGHGFSGPDAGTITAEHLAESLHAIVTHFHLQERGFALAAWSFGGMVLREYLLRYGEQGVTHLILIAALTNMLNLWEIWEGEEDGQADAEMMTTLTAELVPSLKRDAALKRFVGKLTARAQVVTEYYTTLGYNTHSLLHLEKTPIDLLSFTEEGAGMLLKNLSMPVLVLYGNHDALVPQAYLDAQLVSLPSTTMIRRYAGCGHSPHLELPRYLVSDTLAFLQAPPFLPFSSRVGESASRTP